MKLSKQIVKELKRSPAKAAALGGGLLLALWFWLPLIGGWLGAESDRPRGPARDSAAVPAASTAAAAPRPAEVGSAGEATIDWRAIVAWRHSNSYAGSYRWLAENRNPFEEVVPDSSEGVVDAAEVKQQQVDTAIAREMATQKLASELESLQLTSTLITPRGRSAVINGKVYYEGEEIKLNQPSEEVAAAESEPAAAAAAGLGPAEVRLKRVESQSVTIQHGNQLYPLSMKRKNAAAIQLERR